MTNPLKIASLTQYLGKTKILSDINLTLTSGEVFGFIGPNGAGKTTTMKAILGILTPTEGTVTVLGGSPHDEAIRARIGFMPENTYLYKYLTGDEFLQFNGSFYHMTPDRLQKRIDWVLARVGLEGARKKRLSTYSKGMLQRIGLAQSILHDPEILFLDEPMSGLDPIGRRMVKDLIIELKGSGKTIFFNTHILPDVEMICDHFAIIDQGRIVADIQTRDLDEPLEDFFIRHVHTSTDRI